MESIQQPTHKPKTTEFEKETGNKLSDFQVICEIGRGSYGGVYRVLSLVTNNEYAMKKINMKHVKLKHQKEALKEVQILKKVRNPYIIRYYTSFVEDEFLYIIMELAEGGDLAALIKQNKERRKYFSEKQIWDFAWELCHAIDYLHNNNIIHRDIKTLNIFITKDNHIKLGDLGVSKIVSSAASLQGTRVGTPLYLSPELVKQLPYDFKVDIWALGCVIYHLAALEPPFMGDNLITLGYNIVHKNPKALPDSYTNKLTMLINKFLEKNPSSRPKISDMWDYFPQKVKGKALFSEPNENLQPGIVNRIELHNVNSAKLLKVEEVEKKPQDKDKSLGSPLKKPSANMRPTTAGTGVSRIVTKDNNFIQDKLGLNLLEVRAGNNSPTRLAVSNRNKSPVKRTGSQLEFVTEINPVSKREIEDQKNPLTEKRHQDTESTVENKPRNFQGIATNLAGNDTTLSAQQIKDNENLRRFSKAREPSTKIDEIPTDKKSTTTASVKAPGEHIRPLTAQPVTPAIAIQTKEPKEVNKSLADARKSSAIFPSSTKKADEILPKNATPIVVNAFNPAFNSYFSQGLPGAAGQRADNGRPQTSDAAKRMLMNPLIKSTSPRFKINTKASQMPMPNYSGVKPSMEVVGNGIQQQQGPKSGFESRHKNSLVDNYNEKDTPDSKDIKKDMSDSVEPAVNDDSKKRAQTQGSSFSNEIRIRPVSAHIMKRMHNNLNQITENAKEPKPSSHAIAAGLSKAPAAEEAEKEKPKNVTVERPKSAVFAGRLGPKPVQFNREQVDIVKNFKIGDGMGMSSKGLSGGWMLSNPSSTATSEKVKGFGDKSKKRN